MTLTIDGTEFTTVFVRSPITRKAVIKDSSNSGFVLSGQYKRDLIGTYFNFGFTLDMTNVSREDYDTLYEILTNPVESHVIKVPYGQQMVEQTFYITDVSDQLIKKHGTNFYWRQLSFTATGQTPVKEPV